MTQEGWEVVKYVIHRRGWDRKECVCACTWVQRREFKRIGGREQVSSVSLAVLRRGMLQSHSVDGRGQRVVMS